MRASFFSVPRAHKKKPQQRRRGMCFDCWVSAHVRYPPNTPSSQTHDKKTRALSSVSLERSRMARSSHLREVITARQAVSPKNVVQSAVCRAKRKTDTTLQSTSTCRQDDHVKLRAGLTTLRPPISSSKACTKNTTNRGVIRRYWCKQYSRCSDGTPQSRLLVLDATTPNGQTLRWPLISTAMMGRVPLHHPAVSSFLRRAKSFDRKFVLPTATDQDLFTMLAETYQHVPCIRATLDSLEDYRVPVLCPGMRTPLSLRKVIQFSCRVAWQNTGARGNGGVFR